MKLHELLATARAMANDPPEHKKHNNVKIPVDTLVELGKYLNEIENLALAAKVKE